MKIKGLCVLFFLSPIALSCIEKQEVLIESVQFDFMSDQAKREALENGIWNSTKSKFVFCFSNPKPACYVSEITDEGITLIDISGVVSQNLGKLGLEEKSIEKSSSYPSGLREEKVGEIQLEVTTQVWVNGIRHTVKEPLRVINNEPVYR